MLRLILLDGMGVGYMPKAIVVVGNVSSHGNVVQAGSSKTKAGGIMIAYVSIGVSGDGLLHGPNNIAGPNTRSITKFGGKAVAANGAPTACGASMGTTNIKTKLV